MKSSIKNVDLVALTEELLSREMVMFEEIG